jgi:Domain of unknown function (DUF4279)
LRERDEDEKDDIEDWSRRFDVELFIVHPTMTPAEITTALGMQPKIVHGVGEPRRTPRGTSLPGNYPDTRWRFSLRYEVRDQWFAGPVAELVDRLMARKEFLHKVIASGGSASVIVQFLGDGYFGDNIFTDTLAKLGELGLELGLECFG